MQILLIANENSKNAADQCKEFEKAYQYFEKKGIKALFVSTSNVEELRAELMLHLANGVSNYAVMGGDGSLHHLVNEFINLNADLSKINIGLIPMGTGNDWVKNFDNLNKKKAIDNIAGAKTKPVDIGKVTFRDGRSKIYCNISGIGFNGAVIQHISKFKFLGSLAYYAALLYTFSKYKGEKIKVKIDDNEYSENVFILTIGIGKYAGGDMLLCPDAILDDGYFDINLIKDMSKFKLIQNLPRLKDGSYLKHTDTISLRARKVEILENNHLYCEADGEFFGKEIKSFEILEKQINVFVD